MKIAVVGCGYVGLSLAVLLAQNNQVTLLDIIPDKILMVNNKKSPIKDNEISKFLATKPLNLSATQNPKDAYQNADFIIIATPTNYDPQANSFDTKSIEEVIKEVLLINPGAYIVIKSTIPIGYTESLKIKFSFNNITFSPEFLREGRALYDNLYPSRIIIGDSSKKAKQFAVLLSELAEKKDVNILYTGCNEAEAIKLFSNSYLAMRVAYFNEIDTYAEINKLSSRDIISGVSLDSRIGMHYNNPSFGYGGYCLPKDTKQLKEIFSSTPHSIVSSIVEANSIRKDFISNSIVNKNPKVVGVYRLVMKSDSDNFRESSILGIINRLCKKNIKVIIFEPLLKDGDMEELQSTRLISSLKDFKEISDIIITNRIDSELEDVQNKVYSRDLFNID